MLAHVEPSAFSRAMSATTAQRSYAAFVLIPVFGSVALRPSWRFVRARIARGQSGARRCLEAHGSRQDRLPGARRLVTPDHVEADSIGPWRPRRLHHLAAKLMAHRRW